MTNNFFNSLKSVFVTEIPDENTNVEQVTNNNVMKETSVQPTQVMFTSNVVNTQKTIEGQINEELLQKLCKVMDLALIIWN